MRSFVSGAGVGNGPSVLELGKGDDERRQPSKGGEAVRRALPPPGPQDRLRGPSPHTRDPRLWRPMVRRQWRLRGVDQATTSLKNLHSFRFLYRFWHPSLFA